MMTEIVAYGMLASAPGAAVNGASQGACAGAVPFARPEVAPQAPPLLTDSVSPEDDRSTAMPNYA